MANSDTKNIKKITEDAVKLSNEYPLLMHNADFTLWEGYLAFENNQFKVKIHTPFFPSTKDISFICPSFMKPCVKPHIDNLIKSDTLLGFIDLLIHILKSNKFSLSNQVDIWDRRLIRLYQSVLSELETSVGIENIIEIQEDLRTIKMKYTDIYMEDHILEIMVPQDYPKGDIYLLEADLPNDVLIGFSKVNSISRVYSLFKSSVDTLLPFWTMCNELEKSVWVIDPQNPKKKDVYRRISVNDSLSVVLTFNPFDLSSLPDVKFLGSLNAVSDARQIYLKNLDKYGWNSELNVSENLKLLLSVEQLPSKPIPTAEDSGNAKVCLICYDDDIEKEVPFKWCTNDKCTSWYHFCCILKWCQSQVTSSTLYNHISGTCPFCNEKIWCPLPSRVN